VEVPDFSSSLDNHSTGTCFAACRLIVRHSFTRWQTSSGVAVTFLCDCDSIYESSSLLTYLSVKSLPTPEPQDPCSPQPDTSLHCQTMNRGLVHLAVCLFTSVLSQVLIAPIPTEGWPGWVYLCGCMVMPRWFFLPADSQSPVLVTRVQRRVTLLTWDQRVANTPHQYLLAYLLYTSLSVSGEAAWWLQDLYNLDICAARTSG